MTDCGHHHDHNADARRLLWALAVVAIFLVVEIIGGLISGSLALLADAAHMATDAMALGLAASAHWISSRPPNRRLHFGYQRAQVLAAFVNGVALVGMLFWIVYEAISRFFAPVDVAWRPMLIVALLGLAANGVAFMILHRGASENINIRGAMLHVISDLLGSVVAVIAALTIALSGWTRIDPLLSIIVAALIARAAYSLLRETSHILLEGAPDHIDSEKLKGVLEKELPGVANIHDVHIWQITPSDARLTLHAVVKDQLSVDETRLAIEKIVRERFDIAESTIQIEIGETCPDHRAHAHAHAHIHAHAHSGAYARAHGEGEGRRTDHRHGDHVHGEVSA